MSRACYIDDIKARDGMSAEDARSLIYKTHELCDFLRHKFGLTLTRNEELMLEGELGRLFDANKR